MSIKISKGISFKPIIIISNSIDVLVVASTKLPITVYGGLRSVQTAVSQNAYTYQNNTVMPQCL